MLLLVEAVGQVAIVKVMAAVGALEVIILQRLL
jgi:hypothetical protein